MSDGLKKAAKEAAKAFQHFHTPACIEANDASAREVCACRAEFMYRGKRYAVTPCPGNAHTFQSQQDHCSLCMPLWDIVVEFLP